MTLLNLFLSLEEPETGTFNAAKIYPDSLHRIAKDDRGLPCLLIACHQDSTTLSNISLKYLKVQNQVSCRIIDENFAVQQIFTVVRFEGREWVLQEYFLRISESIVATLPNAPSGSEITQIIYRYIEVLRQLTETPKKSVQGLWAELLVILESQNIETMLDWWHNLPEDRYDFNAPGLKYEVKSSSSNERIHHFSAEQLSLANHQIIIISVLMRIASSGISIGDLRERIIQRLVGNLSLIQKLDMVIARTLGNSVEGAYEITYDFNWAKNSIRCYLAETIPGINVDSIPIGVSDVRFRADLNFASKSSYNLDYLQSSVSNAS